jgi:hypothetical protein
LADSNWTGDLMVSPDIAGWRDAQSRLRDALGTSVVFLKPVALDESSYPAGTSFDPETGLPFDPVVEPTVDTDPERIEVTASVVHRPIDTDVRDAATNQPIGLVASSNLALLLDVADKETVEGSTEVEIWGQRHRITEWRPDGLTDLDRWIVFVEEM